MAALATEADLEARLGRDLTATEQTRAAAYLDDASALIRSYARQDFTVVTDDVVELRPVGTKIRLPQRPVTSVSSVVAIGWAGSADVTLSAGTWGFDGIDTVEVWPLAASQIVNLPETWADGSGPDTYRITYTHGEATAPDDVVAVCCAMVLRVLVAPSLVEGMSAERIGQYSYQMSQQVNGGSAGAAVKLSETDKQALARYRRKATTVQLVL